jgi:hypothetical protein
MAMMLLFREKDFIFGFSILFRMEDWIGKRIHPQFLAVELPFSPSTTATNSPNLLHSNSLTRWPEYLSLSLWVCVCVCVTVFPL